MNAFNNMRKRLEYRGGDQQERMIKDKRETLDRVVLYSYQGAKVSKDGVKARALINPNLLKPDYDDKIISIGFEHNYKPGTVFKWENTDTTWLIYLQDLTELAYFKGDIRKCNFEIAWTDENGELHSTAVAIRGPKETKINSIIKEGNSIDIPNYTLNMLVPYSKEIAEYFKRYTKFYLRSPDESVSRICWQVQALDAISMPGVLELDAAEYYSNTFEDDVENGIVGGLIAEPIIPSTGLIEGDTFIKPKVKQEYTYTGTDAGEWVVETNLPIEKEVNDNKITIKCLQNYSGQIVLKYNDSEKTIIVESLFAR